MQDPAPIRSIRPQTSTNIKSMQTAPEYFLSQVVDSRKKRSHSVVKDCRSEKVGMNAEDLSSMMIMSPPNT